MDSLRLDNVITLTSTGNGFWSIASVVSKPLSLVLRPTLFVEAFVLLELCADVEITCSDFIGAKG